MNKTVRWELSDARLCDGGSNVIVTQIIQRTIASGTNIGSKTVSDTNVVALMPVKLKLAVKLSVALMLWH